MENKAQTFPRATHAGHEARHLPMTTTAHRHATARLPQHIRPPSQPPARYWCEQDAQSHRKRSHETSTYPMMRSQWWRRMVGVCETKAPLWITACMITTVPDFGFRRPQFVHCLAGGIRSIEQRQTGRHIVHGRSDLDLGRRPIGTRGWRPRPYVRGAVATKCMGWRLAENYCDGPF